MIDTTPVILRNGVFIKRDDLYTWRPGVHGGKARGLGAMLDLGAIKTPNGLVTCGSRSSLQIYTVAAAAKHLGIPCQAHCPTGELCADIIMARDLLGAEITQHDYGYTSLLKNRAKLASEATGGMCIPWGMEHPGTISAVSKEAFKTFLGCTEWKRLVVPLGSGMQMAGILRGLDIAGFSRRPVLGVRVGGDPQKKIKEWGPPFAQFVVVESALSYHKPAPRADVEAFGHGLRLDPHYEAKCVPFLEPGDLLWVVGLRPSELGEK